MSANDFESKHPRKTDGKWKQAAHPENEISLTSYSSSLDGERRLLGEEEVFDSAIEAGRSRLQHYSELDAGEQRQLASKLKAEERPSTPLRRLFQRGKTPSRRDNKLSAEQLGLNESIHRSIDRHNAWAEEYARKVAELKDKGTGLMSTHVPWEPLPLGSASDDNLVSQFQFNTHQRPFTPGVYVTISEYTDGTFAVAGRASNGKPNYDRPDPSSDLIDLRTTTLQDAQIQAERFIDQMTEKYAITGEGSSSV